MDLRSLNREDHITSYPANLYRALVCHVHIGSDKVESAAFRTSVLFHVVVVHTLLICVISVQSGNFKPCHWPTLASTMKHLVKVFLGSVLSEQTLKWILHHSLRRQHT